MTTRGIDYGSGRCNIDKSNGIRFGVIHQNEVLQAWADSSEANYGEPHCPKCGNEAVASDSEQKDVDLCLKCGHNHGIAWGGGSKEPHKDSKCHDCACTEPDWASDYDRDELGYETLHHACGDYACDACRILFDGEDAFGDDPVSFTYEEDGYVCEQGGDDCDIFIMKSPYFTRAQFCSPCAPGACYLTSPTEDGERAYCFGHDFFDSGESPYPVYSVETGELVLPERNTNG